MLFTLISGIVTFTLMYVWLVIHRQRTLTAEDLLDDAGLEQAIEERRREALSNSPLRSEGPQPEATVPS